MTEPVSLDEFYWRRKIAQEIEEYADSHHEHVEAYGFCSITQGDRCDVTSALLNAAKRVRKPDERG